MLLGLFSIQAVAQTPAQVDLSVSVSMTPPTFVPGAHGTFTVTVNNAGPDAAGMAGFGNVNVYSNSYIVTTQPPPFELGLWPVEGDCSTERFVTEPLPDGNIGLLFAVYFGVIPAGESRSCTIPITFYPSTRSSFSTHWQLASSPNFDDIDPANDYVDYVFHVHPVMVPVQSTTVLTILASGLLLIVGWASWRNGQPRPR
jgi:hypothetical protein